MPRLPNIGVGQDEGLAKFIYGKVTRVKKEGIPRGAASDSLNWLTRGDHIELRRGQKLLGTEVTGSGKITGLKVCPKYNETAANAQVLYTTYARKIRYFDPTTEDWIESGSNVIDADANGEDIAIVSYKNIMGAYAYFSSPNSSIYKICVANPGSVVNQNSTNYRGKIKVARNRMLLWDRKDTSGRTDKTSPYGSYLDKDELSDYTQTSGEAYATGDGTTKTFAHTLADITGVRTAGHVTVTDGVETFTDDLNGNLTGDLGGTGTVNYATGACSVTFNTAPTNLAAITCSYYREDATSTGVVDFSKSATRTAGQGFVLRQHDNGPLQNMVSIDNDEIMLHTSKGWKVQLQADDSDASNLLYRNRVGIPYWRAAAETSRGGLLLDDADENGMQLKLIRRGEQSGEILDPVSLSEQLDLSNYDPDAAVVGEWGEYEYFALREKDSTYNNRMFVRHKDIGCIDELDYFVSAADIYNGALVAGDPIANNVYELFSGVDDAGSEIPNYWISGNDDLDVPGVKDVRVMELKGEIGPDQTIKIYLSYDNATFVLVKTIVSTDSYVNRSTPKIIGGTMGGVLGGGATAVDNITAYEFENEFKVNTPKFKRLRIKIEATGIGWAAIYGYIFKDIRYKGLRLTNQYVSN